MIMATLKCWHERENTSLPPIIESSTESKTDNFNKK